MDKFLYQGKNWFHDKYATKLGIDLIKNDYSGRYPTIKIALNLFLQRKGKTIIETGCQNTLNDWGAGCGTKILSEFVDKYGGHLHTVDIDPDNLKVARQIIGNPENTTLTCEDSVLFLKRFSYQIDFLYLDSWDYPYGKLLEAKGGKEDLAKAINILQAMEDDEIVAEFQNIILPSQEHCLNEIKAALPLLHKNSILLIDDSCLPGGGKSRLATEYLRSNGWEIILSHQQDLWIKGNA